MKSDEEEQGGPYLVQDFNGHHAIVFRRARKLAHYITLHHFVNGGAIQQASFDKLDHEYKRATYDVQLAATRFLKAARERGIETNPNAESAIRAIEACGMDVKKATMQELISFYNERNSAKPITRFADRKTAERRVGALLSANDGSQQSEVSPANPAQAESVPAVTSESEDEEMKKRTTKRRAVKRATTGSTKARSAAISASWENNKVAKARSTKHKVQVGKQVYRSVLAAFQALKLDQKKHIRFRRELKAAGHKKFGDHWFKLVE